MDRTVKYSELRAPCLFSRWEEGRGGKKKLRGNYNYLQESFFSSNFHWRRRRLLATSRLATTERNYRNGHNESKNDLSHSLILSSSDSVLCLAGFQFKFAVSLPTSITLILPYTVFERSCCHLDNTELLQQILGDGLGRRGCPVLHLALFTLKETSQWFSSKLNGGQCFVSKS